jgi:hypothetical protein
LREGGAEALADAALGYMSEGPEVRRTADRLQEALVGRVIESVEFRRKSGGLARSRRPAVGDGADRHRASAPR